MYEKIYPYAHTHHKELIEVVERNRQVKPISNGHPSLMDFTCHYLGSWMVSAGGRLKAASKYQSESALIEISGECQGCH